MLLLHTCPRWSRVHCRWGAFGLRGGLPGSVHQLRNLWRWGLLHPVWRPLHGCSQQVHKDKDSNMFHVRTGPDYSPHISHKSLCRDSRPGSGIYKWTDGSFQLYQNISTQEARAWKHFTIDNKVRAAPARKRLVTAGLNITNRLILTLNSNMKQIWTLFMSVCCMFTGLQVYRFMDLLLLQINKIQTWHEKHSTYNLSNSVILKSHL